MQWRVSLSLSASPNNVKNEKVETLEDEVRTFTNMTCMHACMRCAACMRTAHAFISFPMAMGDVWCLMFVSYVKPFTAPTSEPWDTLTKEESSSYKLQQMYSKMEAAPIASHGYPNDWAWKSLSLRCPRRAFLVEHAKWTLLSSNLQWNDPSQRSQMLWPLFVFDSIPLGIHNHGAMEVINFLNPTKCHKKWLPAGKPAATLSPSVDMESIIL